MKSFTGLTSRFQLEIDKSFTPELGTTVTGSDFVSVAGIGVDAWFAGASIDFDIEQNDYFTSEAINGTLLYGLEGSGETQTLDISMTGGAPDILDVNLDQPGTWDFTFLPFSLENAFNVGFDLELVARAYYKTLHVPEWYQFWDFYWETHSTEFALLDINVYDADPFSLTFNPDIIRSNVFSISVDGGGDGGGGGDPSSVPEPSMPLLLFSGLFGLAVYGRKRLFKK
ncbi:MAG: PEP-CTERM sorting domain-containing protein [Chitinispirillaceae bacterium]|nr:PEP-CTERM sorting domain-containing protein [Chitinispirillaceae bacterium]